MGRLCPTLLVIIFGLAFVFAPTATVANAQRQHRVMSYGATTFVPGSDELGSPLFAQWSNTPQQESGGIGNVRARSIIKLGLLIVTIVGGFIAFVVRMATGNQATGQAGTTPQQPAGAAVYNPTTSAASYAPPGKPPAASQSSGWSTTAVVLTVVFGLCGLAILGGALLLGLFLFWGVSRVSQQQMVELSEGDILRQMNAVQEAQRSQLETLEQAEFDARWKNAIDGLEKQIAADGGEAATNGESLSPLIGEALPSEATEPAKLPTPEQPLSLEWRTSDAVPSGLYIANRGMSFEDFAPDNALLVGFDVTSPGHRVTSIQPIYQLKDAYVLGQRYGKPQDAEAARLLARPGFAVSAIRLELSGRVDGLQLEFARFRNGKLDQSTKYASPFFGRNVATKTFVVEGEGDCFVGVAGKIDDGFDGLALLRNMALQPSEFTMPQRGSNPIRVLAQRTSQTTNPFQDEAPDGGVMVGLRVFTGMSWGGSVRALQPIYQLGDKYVVGERHGPDGGIVKQTLAEPGFAVSSIETSTGLILNSVLVGYSKVESDGLAHEQQRVSPRFGSPGGSPFQLQTHGRFAVGIRGGFHREISSLQLLIDAP